MYTSSLSSSLAPLSESGKSIMVFLVRFVPALGLGSAFLVASAGLLCTSEVHCYYSSLRVIKYSLPTQQLFASCKDSFLPAGHLRSTCPAGTKIALHSRICLCVRPQLSRALSYVIPLLYHYSHKRSAMQWKLVEVQAQ